MGVRADLERMRDAPRATVVELRATGDRTARLVLRPVTVNGTSGDADLEFTVEVGVSDPGWDMLRGWRDEGSVLAVVMPPESSLLRLRGLDDLQPLTLRRLDAGR